MSKEKETDLPEEKKQAIRPEELRLNNLVHREDGSGVLVDALVIVEALQRQIANGTTGLLGIELSPEWLERLGFKDRSGTLANRMAFGITLPGNVLELAWYIQSAPRVEGIRFQTTGSGVTYDTKITTVHGLQNLFYSLTGEELKLGGVC